MKSRSSPSDLADQLARRQLATQLLAYLSPYLFWALVCLGTGGIWLLGSF